MDFSKDADSAELNKQPGESHEVIDGKIVMLATPSTRHQVMVTGLLGQLYNVLDGKNCSPIDNTAVKLEENNNDILVPDLFVYCEPSRLKDNRYEGAPTLVVEVLSPGTGFNDFTLKKRKYETAGVQEYWIINPDIREPFVWIHAFTDNTYKYLVKPSAVRSDSLPNCVIDFAKIYESIARIEL
jgi:Uma2 family endonuclease